MCVRLVSLCRWLACAAGGNGSDCFLAAVLSLSAKLYLDKRLRKSRCFNRPCIYLLIPKTSFPKSLFRFQFELMCEVHLPKSKHNSFKLMIFDLGKKLTLFSKCSLYERSSLLLFIVLSCISFNNELLCNDVTTM